MVELKKNEDPNEAHNEEIFDQELKNLMGDHYVDATVEPMKEADVTNEAPEASPWAMYKDAGCLVAADALLIFMCLADKIELAYGLVFLAAASAFLGAKVSNARV